MMYSRFVQGTCVRNTLRVLSAASLFLLLSVTPRTGRTDPPPNPKGSGSSGETPFLFGCDWPVSGSPAVKSLFFETGCNFVRVTGGGYGWALDSHRKALQELDAHGIKALLQLGSHYPDARFFEFKDSYLFDQKGETGKEDRNAWAITYNGSAWPQYSYASETFRDELAKDFTTYLNGVKDNANVSALLLHNEPGYHWIDDRIFDYNPQAIAQFRAYLRREHGTLEDLNRRWGTQFASFETAEPPHELPPVTNMAAWLDWRRFNADLIQDFLRSQVAFAHRTRPGAPTTTNLSGPLDNWYPVRVGDNYRYTADFDIAGIDIYPTEWTSPVFPGYTMDMTRGAAPGKKLYVAECEVFDPTRFRGLSEDDRAGMLRSEVWTFIGHGADAVLLWSLSGQEGFRLTQGEFNARVAATREIAHLSPMLHLGAFQKPESRIAVCVDQDAYLYYGGRQPKIEGGFRVDQDARGIYGAVVAGRYQADVVSAAQLRQGIGKRYAAIVLSTPVLMDPELSTQLRAFVGDGGLLIAEAPFATRDRWGKDLPQQPGFGLDTLFGVQGVQTDTAVSGQGNITTPDGTFAGENRTKFQAAADARVVGTFADKTPAVVVHPFQKGTAVYIAAEVGGPNAARWATGGAPPGLNTFIAATLTRYAHLPPTVNVTHQGATFLDTSVRSDKRGNHLVVLTNPTDRGKPLPPATNVFLSLSPPSSVSAQVFLFPPTRHTNGRVTAGPQPLPARNTGTGRPGTLPMPDIASALPVLFARNFSPLLTIDAPETTAAGTEIDVRVTCYNPSSQPLRVTPALVLPSSWKLLTPSGPVVVPARGERSLPFRVRSGAGEERAVIKARVGYTTGSPATTASVDSVPVDITTKAVP